MGRILNIYALGDPKIVAGLISSGDVLRTVNMILGQELSGTKKRNIEELDRVYEFFHSVANVSKGNKAKIIEEATHTFHAYIVYKKKHEVNQLTSPSAKI